MISLRFAVPVLAVALVSLTAAITVSLANTGRGIEKDQRQKIFIISDQGGYGTGECLDKPDGCGKIIADSFCESKGFTSADYYRRADADEVTGSIASERKPTPRDPQAFVIACK
ncbi:MAG: hypothetical protein ACKVON_10370 [Beijerinckiaceae bacterium]